MIEMYKEWYEARHEYAKEWKEKTGGKVLGYFCTYVPEEILYAAGVLPVRILGSHEPQNVSEPHIFAMFCPFCRDCLAQGLQGRYGYLDGIMIAQSCLHVRQAYTSWDLHIPTEFSYYLSMPHHVQSPHAAEFLRGEYKTFISKVENWTGKKITDDDLKRGIDIMNRSRTLMKSVYETRKKSDVPITGLDAMYMVVASQMIEKSEHARATEGVIKELAGRSTGKENATRLMLLGSENDDVEFIEMVESLNAVIVQDDHCTGTRYFWDVVESNGDPLTAIARRYVKRLPCPTKDWPDRRRMERILQFAKEWNVAGAIVIQQKFCDPHEIDIPAIRKALEAAGVKVLFLEFDVTVPVGQFRIRVEAFLEMLSEEDLF
ncbi:MAG: benzoyl-CoA reductase, bzd-type, subunit N [Chitinispirillaceae bacterium]|nr:benzoyl-CoA reductase, bzd-type, subunit N [Chitinispirillaceae bacterium]